MYSLGVQVNMIGNKYKNNSTLQSFDIQIDVSVHCYSQYLMIKAFRKVY